MEFTKESLFKTVQKTYANAGELMADAKFLKANGRFARAYNLYQLGIEEIEKARFIYEFLIMEDFTDKKEQKKFLNTFASHSKRLSRSLSVEFLVSEIKDTLSLSKDDLEKLLKDKNPLHPTDDIKSCSLLTTCINDEVHLPSELITEKVVTGIETKASFRLIHGMAMSEMTLEEIDQLISKREKMDREEFERKTDAFISEILNGD